VQKKNFLLKCLDKKNPDFSGPVMPKNHNHFRTIWALNNNVDSKTPCTAIHISLQMKLETSNLVHGTWVDYAPAC